MAPPASAPQTQRPSLRASATLAGVALLAAACCSCDSDPARAELDALRALRDRGDVNVVLILVDTLRADRLGCYGHSRDTSPTLDALARGGIRFARVESQSSWTKPSMASLWTATYPAANGIQRLGDVLPADALTAAEWLREQGFRTQGLFRNAFVAPKFGFQQGFEQYRYPSPGRRPDTLRRAAPSNYRLPGSDRDLVVEAEKFLDAVGGQRFLLYLHFMDVHRYVYQAEVSFGSELPDAYDASVAWVDANVRKLRDALEARGLLSRSVLVVASDHGETLEAHWPPGHGATLFRETTHVPWIIALPFPLARSIVVDAPAENLDLWPTLLELLGLPPLPGSQGRSRLPWIEAAMRGRAPPDAAPRLVAQLDRTWTRPGAEPDPLVAISEGRFRLIGGPLDPAGALLFDHATDATEQHDVADRHPEIVKRLLGAAREHLAQPATTWSRMPEMSLSPEQLEPLRALGYAVPE